MENYTEAVVRRAEERILGTKFCFSCQKQRNLEGGKSVRRLNGSRTWKCAVCYNKAHPAGFKGKL